MREIEWAAFHLSEDEKDKHEYLINHLDLLLSFVNPEFFKKYSAGKNKGSQIENEAFEEEIKNKLGLSLEQLKKLSDDASEPFTAEEVDPGVDIIGDPIVG